MIKTIGALAVAAAAFFSTSVAGSAATLFSTGDSFYSSGRCISGPGDCFGSGQWTVYDDFILGENSTVTGLTYYADRGEASQYSSTTYSIFSDDPFQNDAFASATVTGTAVDTDDGLIAVTLTGLNLALDGATNYWLGITTTTSRVWHAARTSDVGYGSGFKQSAGGFFHNYGPFGGDFAFSLQGEPVDLAPVPLPASGLLLIGAFAGAAAWRRKSKA